MSDRSVVSYETQRGILWRFNVRLGQKIVTRRGFKTEGAAKKAKRDVQTQYDHGIKPTNPRLRLGEYLEQWYSGLEGTRNIGANQYIRIGQHLAHILPELGDIKISDLEKGDVIRLRKKLELVQAPRTIKHMENMLKGALNDGLKENRLAKNPLQFFTTISISSLEIKEVEIFEPEDQRRLLSAARAYAKEQDPRWFLMVFLLLNTGMRKGELFALQWRHIDLEQKIIHVKQSMEYSQGDTKGKLKSPKTAKGTRKIFITENVCSEIRAYKLWLSKFCMKNRLRTTNETFVLFHEDLKPLHKSAPRSRWATIVRRAGLTKRTMHALRHTHASNMIEAGLNVKMLQERLGHSTINITLDTYGHIYKQQGEEATMLAMEKWEASLAKN